MRRVLCEHYGLCLNEATAKGLEDFSCSGCTRYQREASSPDMIWQESLGACRLLLALFPKATQCRMVLKGRPQPSRSLNKKSKDAELEELYQWARENL